MKILNNDRGQTIVEYSLLLGIIMVVIMSMQPMIKRAAQGMIKVVADQIGNQKEADQRAFYANSTVDSYLDRAFTQTEAVQDRQTVEFLGLRNYIHADVSQTDSVQQSNLGFSPEIMP